MSMEKDDIHAIVQDLLMQDLEEIQELLVIDNSAPTEEEAEAVVAALTYMAVMLEGYLIASLSDERRHNLRATLDTLSQKFAERVGPVQEGLLLLGQSQDNAQLEDKE